VTWIVVLGILLPGGIGYTIGRGRDRGGAGLLLGLLLSWLGVLICLFLPTGGMKCPACRERIKFDAIVCKHCGSGIEVDERFVKSTIRATPPRR